MVATFVMPIQLMHVIGFIHEHQRDDRDGYVKILYQNVIEGKCDLSVWPAYRLSM